MKKILIIRFSSIGDIVLTTPVIRCIRQQVKDAEIHFAVKKTFLPVVQANPYIDKIQVLEDDLKVYIRNPADYAVIRRTLDAEAPAAIPRIYLQGDICREILLTEIDGIVGCKKIATPLP